MPSTASPDYVVIGGGPGGAVVANRLTADPGRSVLLLEAGGPDTYPDVSDIGGVVRLWGSPMDWAFQTEPQPGMAGRQITLNQGKVLGGGSILNAMMYVRGNPRNFDLWNALGADGWSFADVLPYFKKIEDFDGGPSDYHGVGGPLAVRVCPDPNMRSEHFQQGVVELGYDGPDWDINGARQENGAGLIHFNITKDGRRASSTSAYLDPVRGRPNLTIETGVFVTRILFEGTRAVGVEVVRDGQIAQVRARCEVIVSAGTLQSPKILMLSGIGPADALAELGIPVVADLPGVGRNLHDHVQLPVVFRTTQAFPSPTLLTGNIVFLSTRPGSGMAAPDLQVNFTPAVPGPLAHAMQFGAPACVFLPILVQPFSRGEVTLRSADPGSPPVVNPNYLACEADVQVLRRAVEICRAIANTRAFSPINGGEIIPGNEDLDGFIRSQSSTIWHPVGTCKIGHDAMAVVDPELRVRGIEGLRVVDASVMPTVTTGNTVAATFMIAEKAADMILARSNR